MLVLRGTRCRPPLNHLIPATTLVATPVPDNDKARFTHLLLAERTVEVLRRWGVIMATCPVAPSATVPTPAAASSSSSALHYRSATPGGAAALNGYPTCHGNSARPALREPPSGDGSPPTWWSCSGCRPQVLCDLFEECTGKPYMKTLGSSASNRLTGFS